MAKVSNMDDTKEEFVDHADEICFAEPSPEKLENPPPVPMNNKIIGKRWLRAKSIVLTTARFSASNNTAEQPVPVSIRPTKVKNRRESVSAQVLREAVKREEKNPLLFMLHPTSNFIAYWTLASMAIICFIFITVPFFTCFDPELPTSYVVVDVLVDIFFLCDIAVNFRTGYYPNLNRPDLVIMDPKKVAFVYTRSWFISDLISGLPMATLTIVFPGTTSATGKFGNALKLLKLGRFLRLVKLAKVSAMSYKLDEFYLDMMVSMRGMILVVRMAKLLAVGFFIVHYVSCAWWLCADRETDNSWIVNSGADHMSVWGQYLFSCYWVISTMTTVGYGDVHAMNDTERAFSIFAMILGGSFYGLLIAKITNIVAESENNQRIFHKRLDEIALFVHDKGFAPELQRRVLRYYQKFLKKTSTVDDAQIIRELSAGIKEKVVTHLLDTVLARHPFFSQLGKQLIEIVPAMRMTLLDYGQYLTRKGQPSGEMVCVVTGSSVILDESSKSFHAGGGEPVLPLLNVHPGALFGERCLLGVDSKYYVTVRALTNCDCYVIYADQFKAALKPGIVRNLRLRLIRSIAFRIRVRMYCISVFEHEADRTAIEKVVRSLPPDPNKRTWSRRDNVNVKEASHFDKAFVGASLDAAHDATGKNSPKSASTTNSGSEDEFESPTGVPPDRRRLSPLTNFGLDKGQFAAMFFKLETLSGTVEELRRELAEERRERAAAEARHEGRYESILKLLGVSGSGLDI